jgi:hypothetical protein
MDYFPDTAVKASGDVIILPSFYDLLPPIIAEANGSIGIVVGGGTAITKALDTAKIPYGWIDGERVIYSREGRILAYEVLEQQRAITRENLKRNGLEATIMLPAWRTVGNDVRHINGDKYIRFCYSSFRRIVVVALAANLEARPKSFLWDTLGKVTVVSL